MVVSSSSSSSSGAVLPLYVVCVVCVFVCVWCVCDRPFSCMEVSYMF